MGYFINHRATSTSPNPPQADAADLAHWRTILETGSAAQRQTALRQLIAAGAEGLLVQCLGSADPAVVGLAAAGLWECWSNEAGDAARQALDDGTDAMNQGDLQRASQTFAGLIERFPDWAEAINKLATVFYLQNRPEASSELCRRVVALKPDHFGAWNGLALCAVQLEDWPLALRAVRESLRLQPHSPFNRQLLPFIESRLSPA